MSVVHPISPVYDDESRILILGSFPSVKSREVGFYYGHKQNRFWRMLCKLLEESDDSVLIDIEAKKNLLHKHHIALWDVIASCNIQGSADESISDVIPNDLTRILDNSQVQMIYINGKKAYELYYRYIFAGLKDKYGRVANAVCLPSTSPANAALSEQALLSAWKRIIIGLNITSKPYYSLNDYANNCYGKKMYRLSLDGGFTCPNRDGSKGVGGCIFCSGDGSGSFAGTGHKRAEEISVQLEAQKLLIASKLPRNKKIGYIAYFQSYTGTYDNVSRLKKLYLEAAADKDVDVISIATRPDCLGEDVLGLLKELNMIKPVWIELGLQTIHTKTARYIRRGYNLKEYDRALQKLQKIGIEHVITHIILGLPGETADMMQESVSYVARSSSGGIKLQLLHVLKNTDLAVEYEKGRFEVLSIDEYLDILKKCIDCLPRDMVVHRLTGDGAKKDLIAPLWSADKKNVLNAVNSMLN